MKNTILSIGCLLLCSCGPNAPTNPTPNPAGETLAACPVQFYGAGVYYIGCVSDFGNALALFRKTRMVESISPYAPPGQEYIQGYWVITEAGQ